MKDDGPSVVMVLLVIFAALGLLVTVALLFVVIKYRPGFAATATMIGALLYGASPVDVVPEALFGPVGLVDDTGVIGLAVWFMVNQIQKRRARRQGLPENRP